MTDAELIALLLSKRICTGFKPDGHGSVDIVYGPDPITAEAADRIEALTAERDVSNELGKALEEDAGQLRAERDRLREAIDYILDGMGIADPDYDIDPDDDFFDAANSEWVRDTLTRLATALKGESHE